MKKTIIIGSLFAGSAVILGAMNAHYLKQFFEPATTESFDTGVRYQMYHALAILVLSNLSKLITSKQSKILTRLFSTGIILFSGSIYLLCAFKSNGIIGLKGLGIMTPIGGLLLIAAWIYLIVAAIKSK